MLYAACPGAVFTSPTPDHRNGGRGQAVIPCSRVLFQIVKNY